jgi:hypothetical protein
VFVCPAVGSLGVPVFVIDRSAVGNTVTSADAVLFDESESGVGLELRTSGVDEDELLAGLRMTRQLAGDKRRWLPGFSPSGFIDNAWRPHVVDTSRGRLDRRAYELCAAYELRSALRSGRLWVPGSRRHADPPRPADLRLHEHGEVSLGLTARAQGAAPSRKRRSRRLALS